MCEREREVFKRYSSPENYMLRKITNSPFQDYTPPRKITESESFSGLLKPLSLSHTHGATANLLYIYITMQADTYKQHLTLLVFSRTPILMSPTSPARKGRHSKICPTTRILPYSPRTKEGLVFCWIQKITSTMLVIYLVTQKLMQNSNPIPQLDKKENW